MGSVSARCCPELDSLPCIYWSRAEDFWRRKWVSGSLNSSYRPSPVEFSHSGTWKGSFLVQHLLYSPPSFSHLQPVCAPPPHPSMCSPCVPACVRVLTAWQVCAGVLHITQHHTSPPPLLLTHTCSSIFPFSVCHVCPDELITGCGLIQCLLKHY